MSMNTVVPFGKYRGQSLEVLAADPEYCEWLAAQPWFRERYANLHTIIINNFGVTPQDTPDHNALQALFIDPQYCLALVYCLGLWKWMKSQWQHTASSALEQAQERYAKAFQDLEETTADHWRYERNKESFDRISVELTEAVARANGKFIVKCEAISFEEKGWDVSFVADCYVDGQVYNYFTRPIWLELKPSLGDDYPSVLRQMKTNCLRLYGKDGQQSYHTDIFILVIGSFDAVGASLDQVKAIFKSSGFRVITTTEINRYT